MATAPAVARRRHPRPPWVRALGYWASQYRRTWRGSLSTSFLFPVLYLSAMGVGLGSLVDHHVGVVAGVPYLDYVGPGVLAATAMQTAINESAYPVMGAIKWARTYQAMLATPLRVVDVLRGHQAWIAVRLATVGTIFLGVLAAFGVVRSWWAPLALPSVVLGGLAFAGPVAAYAASLNQEVGLTMLYRFVAVPLFLFSGTFFPVSRLPGWLQPVAYATPLYHGVSLCRAFVLGGPGWSAVGDAAYLCALGALGYFLALASYRKRLVP